MAVPLVDEPCAPWITWDSITCCDAKDGVTDAAAQTDLVAFASEVLWNLSDRRYGICSTTRRLCVPCSCTLQPCRCWPDRFERIDLGYSPVSEITSVTVDGVAFTDFEVDDWRWLVRTDALAWPRNVAVVVDWEHGIAPSAGAKRAARAYACELAKRCTNDPSCQIPNKATEMNMQGMRTIFVPPNLQQILERGGTGVAEVDTWLGSLHWQDTPASRIVDPAEGHHSVLGT